MLDFFWEDWSGKIRWSFGKPLFEVFALLEGLAFSIRSTETQSPMWQHHLIGVLLHHRGAYLKSVHLIVKWPLHRHCVYLWTVPIFHLNGWFFPYAVAAVAGVNVCLRKVVANDIFAAVKEHKVTHICGAPIVMSTMFLNRTMPQSQRALHRKMVWLGISPLRGFPKMKDVIKEAVGDVHSKVQ